MKDLISFTAYDITHNILPFDCKIDLKEDAGSFYLRVTVKNISDRPVFPALFQILEWDSKLTSLHIFKPGFNKPSDNAWFYTAEAGIPHGECNTWISDNLECFSDTSLLFSTMSAMQTSAEDWILWGFSTFEAYHGVIEYDTKGENVIARAWIEGERSRFDPGVWVDLEELTIEKGSFMQCIDRYCHRLTKLHGKRSPEAITGWSDWEYYRIPGKNEKETIKSIVKLDDLRGNGWPINCVVVDAGWCDNIYRWDTLNEKFPHGAEWLCQQIRKTGAIPGIWIAPWLMTHLSPLIEEHPDWLVIDRSTKKPHFINREDGQTIHTLDFSVPEAVQWFRQQIRMILGWGYRYLKLDGPVFIHYQNTYFHDPYSTRYKQINTIMRLLREECGDNVLIESEGVYGPAVGIADIHRVTQDEHPRWYNPNGKPVLAENTPTTLCSCIFNRRLWSNENLLVLRDAPTPFYEFYPRHSNYKETLLTTTELRTTATSVWFTCSSVFFSAPLDLTLRSPEHAEVFRRLVPASTNLKTWPVDVDKDLPTVFYSVCENRSFIHVYNHSEIYNDEVEITLDDEYHIYDYWNERYLGRYKGKLIIHDIPPRGCRLLWITPAEKTIVIVGATGHIAGIGISLIDNPDGSFSLYAPSFAHTEQKVILSIPENMKVFSSDDNHVLCDNRVSGIVTISFIADDKPVILTAMNRESGPV